jgi:hypothetical protein
MVGSEESAKLFLVGKNTNNLLVQNFYFLFVLILRFDKKLKLKILIKRNVWTFKNSAKSCFGCFDNLNFDIFFNSCSVGMVYYKLLLMREWLKFSQSYNHRDRTLY